MVYSLVQVVVLAALPDPASAARPLAAAAATFLGPVGATLMAFAALISVYGYIAGAMVNVPRLTYAMAQEADLPALFGRGAPDLSHPIPLGRHLLGIDLADGRSSSFLQNLSLSAISRLLTYGLVCAALVRFRRWEATGTGPSLPPARFRAAAGPALAALGDCLLAHNGHPDVPPGTTGGERDAADRALELALGAEKG